MRTAITNYQVTGTNQKKRIVMIADIHYHMKYKRERFSMILSKIKPLEPDYICIPGDLLDRVDVSVKADMKPFYHFLKELTNLAPVIMTLGNHDLEEMKPVRNQSKKEDWVEAYYPEWIQTLKKIPNLYFLDSEGVELDHIYFYGYNPPFTYYKSKDKEEQLRLFVQDSNEHIPILKKDCYSILLLHSPINLTRDQYYRSTPIHQFDLILSGHTHNGLMPEWYRGTRGIITPSKGLFPKKVRGKMVKGKTTVIVNSAIIKLSYSSGFFHYFNDLFAMGITVVDLT